MLTKWSTNNLFADYVYGVRSSLTTFFKSACILKTQQMLFSSASGKLRITSWLGCLFFFVSIAALAADKTSEPPELFTRIDRYSVAYLINDNGSFSETRDIAITVLKEQAIPGVKQTSITYSTSIQKAEVIAAYTKKADGRRIDSPKSNFQIESNSGKDKDAPVFSDLTTMTVVFPELEVGDTVVFSYRLTATEPMFPNHFSMQENFPKSTEYDEVRIRVDAPTTLWTQYQARALKEVLNTEQNGRKILEWTFENRTPIKSKRKDFSVYDIEGNPGLEFSTFRSYTEIAAAYGDRARSKAVATDRIRALAADITKDSKTPRETARALYDWVAVNITYAGNCIGLGAVVPHDTDFILDNRMGDCKDHATLLQALLATKDIDSTQALVNSGSAYRLTKIPLVAMVNHVINYIPAFNLYADSTSNSTPFGMLPFPDADKPILLVDGYREGIRTPALAVGTNRQTMKTTVRIQSDGSLTGEVGVSLNGVFAVSARSSMRQMKQEKQDTLVKDIYQRMGYIGSGTFEKDDPTALTDSYNYRVKLEIKNLFQYPGAGAFGIGPFFYNEAPISSYLAGAMRNDDERVDSACSSGHSVEDYTYVLPKGMKVLSIPANMKVTNSFLSYEASYKRKGNVITVHRSLDDRTKGHVCAPQMADEYQEFAKQVLPNLKAQVIYK